MIMKRAELKSQMISQTPDSAKVEALHKELGELEGKLATAKIKFRADLEQQACPAITRPGISGTTDPAGVRAGMAGMGIRAAMATAAT